MNEKFKERYHNDLEFRKEHIKKVEAYQEANPLKYWAIRNITNHRRRGFTVNFKSKDLVEIIKDVKECYLCGIELDYNKKGKSGWVRNSPSVDNIHCKDIIEIDDVQIICAQCNSAKHKMNNEDFIEYCKTIVDRFIRQCNVL